MPRKPRLDAIGMFHHVMNRGVGRRPIFERQDDYRYFKMLLACVHDARIRVHGFSLMPSHYHVLVETCDGQLGETSWGDNASYPGAACGRHASLHAHSRHEERQARSGGRQGASPGGLDSYEVAPLPVGCP